MTIQCDELWLFVRKKKNKQWIWLSMDVCTREMSAYILENEIKKVRKDYGIHCLRFTVSVQFHILIFGIHMQKFFRQGVIDLQQKAAVKQVILND